MLALPSPPSLTVDTLYSTTVTSQVLGGLCTAIQSNGTPRMWHVTLLLNMVTSVNSMTILNISIIETLDTNCLVSQTSVPNTTPNDNEA